MTTKSCLSVALVSACFLITTADAAEIEVLRDQVYSEPSGERLLADIYQPAGDNAHPAVLVVHGGAWTIGNKAHLGFAARKFAEQGFCAVAINYRLAPKYKFPAQLEDCLAAVAWMRSNAERFHIDSKWIAGYGYSAGGHLVALMGTGAAPKPTEGNHPAATQCCLQAIVAGGAPCDFCNVPEEDRLLSYWLGGSRKEQQDLYQLASPLKHISSHCPPMFFFHGEQDSLVPLASIKQMSSSLHDNGSSSELYIVPQKGHILSMFDEEALKRSIEFLKRQSSNGKPNGAGE